MGEEYAALEMSSQQIATNSSSNVAANNNNSSSRSTSHLQCLFLELELGLVAVSMCVGIDCMVIAIASPNAPLGMVKARLQVITEYVQEALSPLTTTAAGAVSDNGAGGGAGAAAGGAVVEGTITYG